uniref:Uncharacterized protein n=1 Tax=Schizaphis graminum TaxID=13262 RepID=A0A2S2NUC2_SCHGA
MLISYIVQLIIYCGVFELRSGVLIFYFVPNVYYNVIIIDSTRPPPLWLTACTTNLRLTRANCVCHRPCHHIHRRHSHRPSPPPQLPLRPWDTISRRPPRSVAGRNLANPPWLPRPRSTFRWHLISTTIYYDIVINIISQL